MEKITIIAIVAAILCSCASTKQVQPVAKNGLVNLINDFNNYVADDSIVCVDFIDLGGRIIHHHIEQADEFVMPKEGIYVVSVKSAKGWSFIRKVVVFEDGGIKLDNPLVIKQEIQRAYPKSFYERKRYKIQ